MYESAQEEISVLQKQLRATVKMEKELRVLVSDLKNDRRDSEDDSEDEDTCGRPERRRTTNTGKSILYSFRHAPSFDFIQ